MSRDFFDLCYDQYKMEYAATEALYSKIGVLLGVIPLVGVLVASLCSLELLSIISKKSFIIQLFVSAGCSIICLVISIVRLFCAFFPRSNYRDLASMKKWLGWKKENERYYCLQLQRMRGCDISVDDRNRYVDAKLFEQMLPKIAEAQLKYLFLNQKRTKFYQMSVFWVGVSIVFVGLQALCYFMIRVSEILNV